MVAQTQTTIFMKTLLQLLRVIGVLFFSIITHYITMMLIASIFTWEIVYKINYEQGVAVMLFFLTLILWIILVFVAINEFEDWFD